MRATAWEKNMDRRAESEREKKKDGCDGGGGGGSGGGPLRAQGVGKITDVHTMFWSTGQGLNNRVLLFLQSCLLQLTLCLVLLNAQGSHSETLPE